MNVRIYVAAHKPYPMPTDSLYVPLGVGAIRNPSSYAVTDATGEQISEKNPYYCELTGLYWVWKNTETDYAGLAHYRRHFANRRLAGDKWARVIKAQQLERILEKTDVVLPKPRHYWIETNWSQYAHAHDENDLIQTRACIETICPAYAPAFDQVMKRTGGHRFNMLIMKRSVLDAYCSWLFPILELLEKKLCAMGDGTCENRVIGFVSERLLDVWLEKNHISYREIPVVNMERQHWLKKIMHFLKRKFAGSQAGKATLRT